METALLVIAAVSLFLNLLAIIVALLLLGLLHRDIRDTLTLSKVNTGRLAGIEKVVVAMHTFMAAELAQSMGQGPMPVGMMPMGMGGAPNIKEIYRTEDGRHEAESFEELMHKISQDPRYRIAKPEDIEELKKRFEAQMEDGEDGEDEVDEDWKKDKEEDGTE